MKGACFPTFLKHYHGMVGKDENVFFRQTPSGKIVLASYNRDKARNRVPTEKELAQRERFKKAHEMAVDLIMDASTRPALEAEYKNQNKYTTLLGYVTAKVFKEV
ncbi:MAG: hypothetical protein MJZ31_12485 [Bacteroidales bacterium]|nr:hypothetical protein [Bacteroidales bacterium]